ncbi:STAS domain-containing protein [Actinotalea sp. AC32]|nr:STAS domain-containing protein [Actinotalea sp. AC32]
MIHDDVNADLTAPADAGPVLTEEPADGIDVVDEGHRLLVRLRGEIDAGLREQASHAMVECMQRDLPVVADLAAVTFIDSSGLAFLLQLHKVGLEEGRPLVLRDPQPNVLELLDMIGMGGLMAVESSAPVV